MSDRTFRLIFDGKKGGLVKGSSPSSAAKKACKKLSAETGKTSFKFELQETTKDSKKKVYGPYKIKVKMAGGVISSLPPFVVNNSNDLPNYVNLSNNFSGVNKSDLAKQLSTLIKIKKRIHKLHDEFSRELSNKKRSVINSLGELPKNTKPLSNTTTLPSLKKNKINKSNINFKNYNLNKSIKNGDLENKFYELSHLYGKINNLILRINETLIGKQIIKADNSPINIEKEATNKPFKIKVNNPFSILINQGNDEYQGLLKIKEVAKNWKNVERILEKNDIYSTSKILELKKKLGIIDKINKTNFFREDNLSKLYEYYIKHKAELKN